MPSLNIPDRDPITLFSERYQVHSGGTAFSFDVAPDPTAKDLALDDLFGPTNPNPVFGFDPVARHWLDTTLQGIYELAVLTHIAGVDSKLQFSLMEALYSRGFVSKGSVHSTADLDFTRAIAGTVAYAYADQIAQNAGAPNGAGDPQAGPFVPVNPGDLVNCIPPWHLSPLGPVNYLHEMLQVSLVGTCDNPFAPMDHLGDVVKDRRGDFGLLQATAANVHTPIPLVDLVNENLEAIASQVAASPPHTPVTNPHGVVYDTNRSTLGGFSLSPADPQEAKNPSTTIQHDPATMFAAIPEHSSPAVPVERSEGYRALETTFTAPALPYSQPADISRAYLSAMGSSRFAAMRAWRRDITEFAINPAEEAVDFQRHLWRYPVRIDTAIEYLLISPEEHKLLYQTEIVNTPSSTQLVLWELYGFPANLINGAPWIAIVENLDEFLTRTGLTYCEFLELWQCKFVTFNQGESAVRFPVCEPCCLKDLMITFPSGMEIDSLRKLVVFIRLWRTLQRVRGRNTASPICVTFATSFNCFRARRLTPTSFGNWPHSKSCAMNSVCHLVSKRVTPS